MSVRYFRPEFVNRIDEIVVFEPLGREELRQIVDIQLAALLRRLAERNLTVDAHRRGARPIWRTRGTTPRSARGR